MTLSIGSAVVEVKGSNVINSHKKLKPLYTATDPNLDRLRTSST